MKLSIVMPSFNQVRFLSPAIESILTQAGDFALELLVMDGGSTDGSIDYLRAIQDPRLTWISEPDRGQTDALLKGLARTTGDVVGWLNSDDCYRPGAFAAVATAFQEHATAQWLVGRCQIIDAAGQEIQRWITRYKDRALRRYSFRRLVQENFICQMSVFWRHDFGHQIGAPDVTLHHAMDYDLWLRMARQSPPLILDQVLSQFRWHSSSKTNTVIRERFREHHAVARRHAGRERWSLAVNRAKSELMVAAYWLLWRLGLLGKRDLRKS